MINKTNFTELKPGEFFVRDLNGIPKLFVKLNRKKAHDNCMCLADQSYHLLCGFNLVEKVTNYMILTDHISAAVGRFKDNKDNSEKALKEREEK